MILRDYCRVDGSLPDANTPTWTLFVTSDELKELEVWAIDARTVFNARNPASGAQLRQSMLCDCLEENLGIPSEVVKPLRAATYPLLDVQVVATAPSVRLIRRVPGLNAGPVNEDPEMASYIERVLLNDGWTIRRYPDGWVVENRMANLKVAKDEFGREYFRATTDAGTVFETLALALEAHYKLAKVREIVTASHGND